MIGNYRKRLAILCGISDYPKTMGGKLPTVSKEIDALEHALSNSLHDGYKYKVISYKDAQVQLEDFPRIFAPYKVDSEIDELLFYFGGHGKKIDDEAYFVSHGTKDNEHGIALRTLAQELNSLYPSIKRIFAIFDFCFSGSIFGYINDTIPFSERVAILTATRKDQLAEVPKDGKSFAQHFIDGLTNASPEKNGEITFGMLAHYIKNQMKDNFVQSPSFLSIGEAAINKIYTKSAKHISTNLPSEPYKGLSYFEEKDSPVFFGKKTDVERLLVELRQRRKLIYLLGDSGSGKTSLIQAGLMPRLKKELDSKELDIIYLRTNNKLLENLLSTEIYYQNESVNINEIVENNFIKSNKKKLVILDQVEALYTEYLLQERNISIKFLQDLIEHKNIIVILICRTDFFTFLNNDLITGNISHSLVNISSNLTIETLYSVIEEPAQLYGVEFDEGLAQEIKEDTLQVNPQSHNKFVAPATVLPLLEFCLTELWKNRENGKITFAMYSQIGKLKGSISKWAQDTFDSFSKENKLIIRRILTQLVYVDQKSSLDSRRVRTLYELCQNDQEFNLVHNIVSRLANARLLVTSNNESPYSIKVEIIHDALFREWGQFQDWLEKDRIFFIWRQELERQFLSWKETHSDIQLREENKLLSKLDIRKIKKSRYIKPTEVYQQYLKPTWLEYYQISRRKLIQHYQNSKKNLAISLANKAKILQDTHPRFLLDAGLIAAKSLNLSYTAQAYKIVNDCLHLIPQTIFSSEAEFIGISHSGNYIALVSLQENSKAQILLYQSNSTLNEVKHFTVNIDNYLSLPSITDVAFSPCDNYIAISCNGYYQSEDGAVSVRNTTWLIEIKNEKTTSFPQKTITQFSPSGKYFIAADNNISIFPIDNSEKKPALEIELDEETLLRNIFITANEYYLLIVTDNNIIFYSLVNKKTLSKLYDAGQNIAIENVCFITKDNKISSIFSCLDYDTDDDANIYICHFLAVNEIYPLLKNVDVLHIKASNTQQYVAIIISLEVNNNSQVPTFKLIVLETINFTTIYNLDFNSDFKSVLFSDDDGFLAVATDKQTDIIKVGVWQRMLPIFHKDYFISFQFLSTSQIHSPKVAMIFDSFALVWDIEAGNEYLQIIEKKIKTLRFISNSCYLLALNADKVIKAWPLSAWGKQILLDKEKLLNEQKPWNSIFISPDGQYLTKLTTPTQLQIFQITNLDLVNTGYINTTGQINSAVFTPYKKNIIISTTEKVVQMWDLVNLIKLCDLECTSEVKTLSIRLDGQYISGLSGYEPLGNLLNRNGFGIFARPETPKEATKVLLWSLETCTQITSFAHKSVRKAVFDLNEKLITISTWNNSAYQWDLSNFQEEILPKNNDFLHDIIFSSNGKYKLTLDNNHLAYLFNTVQNKQIGIIVHPKGINSICFSQDGDFIVTTGKESNIVKVWKSISCQEVAYFQVDDIPMSASFLSFDSKLLLIINKNHYLSLFLWKSTDLISLAKKILPSQLNLDEINNHLSNTFS